jgi:coenzyme F420-0:L-glutamate ligase / coenzyme F420-1:gamma-L-glutamate ligase
LTSTDLHAFLRSRRSVRRFQQKPVDAEIVDRILATAVCAPSAHNRQPWRFAVLTTREPKSRLSEQMAALFRRDLEKDGLPEPEIENRLERSRRRIVDSPVVIIICMDPSEMDIYPDDIRYAAEMTMATQSVAAATNTLLLAAHAEGLSAVWTCSPLFAPETVKAALNLPETWQPQAMVFMGWPDETPKLKELKALEKVVLHIDR